MITVRDLVNTYHTGYSGTGYRQVLEVTLIDTETAEVLFKEMRVEGFLKLVNPDLPVHHWYVTARTPMATRYRGHKKDRMELTLYAPVMEDVPPYYTDEEWECLKNGKLEEDE